MILIDIGWSLYLAFLITLAFLEDLSIAYYLLTFAILLCEALIAYSIMSLVDRKGGVVALSRFLCCGIETETINWKSGRTIGGMTTRGEGEREGGGGVVKDMSIETNTNTTSNRTGKDEGGKGSEEPHSEEEDSSASQSSDSTTGEKEEVVVEEGTASNS